MPVILHKDISSALCHAPRVDGATLKLVSGAAGEAQIARLNLDYAITNRPLYFDGTNLRAYSNTANRVFVSSSTNQLASSSVSTDDLNVLLGAASAGVLAADVQAINNFAGVLVSNGTTLTLQATKFLNIAGTLQLGGTAITATATEINRLDGVTATASEINLVDGSVAGRAVANRALVVDASRNLNQGDGSSYNLNDVRLNGTLYADTVIANNINAPVEGIADSALRWTSPLTLNVTGAETGSVQFHGAEGAVTLTLTENHTHSEYLLLTGNNSATPISGPLNISNNVYLVWQTVGGDWRGMIRMSSTDDFVVGNTGYRTVLGGSSLNFWDGATTNTVWHSGNDGPGSGLHADLLDNNNSTYYLNVSNMNAGTLAIARGGTNSTSYTTNALLYYNGSALVSSTISLTSVFDRYKDNYLNAGYRIDLVGGSYAARGAFLCLGPAGETADYMMIYRNGEYFDTTQDGYVFEMYDGNSTLGRADGGIVFRCTSYDSQGSLETTSVELMTMRHLTSGVEVRIGDPSLTSGPTGRPANGHLVFHEGNYTSYVPRAPLNATSNRHRFSHPAEFEGTTNTLNFVSGSNSAVLYQSGSSTTLDTSPATTISNVFKIRCKSTSGNIWDAFDVNATGGGEVRLYNNNGIRLQTYVDGTITTGTALITNGIQVTSGNCQLSNGFFVSSQDYADAVYVRLEDNTITADTGGSTNYVLGATDYTQPLYNYGGNWDGSQFIVTEAGLYTISAQIVMGANLADLDSGVSWVDDDLIHFDITARNGAGGGLFNLVRSTKVFSTTYGTGMGAVFTMNASVTRYLSADVRVGLRLYFDRNGGFGSPFVTGSGESSFLSVSLLRKLG